MHPRTNRSTYVALRAFALAVAALFACRDAGQPTEPSDAMVSPTAPNGHIQDGAHGGNAHFYFLPPLVPQPAYSGTSDVAQSPEVIVCELNISATDVSGPTAMSKCGRTVAKFSMTTGTASQVIRYDPADQLYVVNWHTDHCTTENGGTTACTLSTEKYYRISVRVQLAELGHLDVDPVGSAGDLRNHDTGVAIPLVNGRTVPVKFRIEQGAVSVVNADGTPTSIGAGGGAIAAGDGTVALVFPAGALSSTADITVAPATSYPANAGELSTPYELGPEGTTFAAPVMLTLAYDPTKLPAGRSESDLRLWTAVDTGWELVPNSTANATDRTVSAPLAHFSTYTVNTAPVIIASPRGPNQLPVPAVAGGQSVEAHVQVANGGGGSLNNLSFGGFFNYYSGTPYPWITASFSPPTAPATATIRVAPPVGLAPGTYTVHTSISGDGATTISYIFSFTVTPPPVIAASPAGPNQLFIPPVSGSGRAQGQVQIANAGGGTLSGLAIGPFVDYATSAPYAWISGSFDGTTAPATLTITAAPPVGQPPGTFRIAVYIGAPGATTLPYYFTVTVTTVYAMVFQSNRDGDGLGGLYVMNTDGAGIQRLTPGLEAGQADWSPDGRRIAFVGQACCHRQIYVMNADGTNRVNITNDHADNIGPDWSPDGTRIAYSTTAVWVINADGTGRTALAAGGRPRWSPDGREILFTRNGTGNVPQVFVMSSDGSNVRELTSDPSSHSTNPAWSPDGTRIVFQRCLTAAESAGCSLDVFIMNADGTNLKNLSNTPGSNDATPQFTPDGRKIGFFSDRDGNWEAYLMNPDGSNQVNLTNAPWRDVEPSFKP